MALQNVPVNNNNLVRWYSTTTPTIATSQYNTGLHNGYLHRWRAQPSLLPVLVGDTLTIYTNFTTNIVGANTFKIAENDAVISDVSLYNITATPWGVRNYKIVLTIPVTNLRENIKFNIVIEGPPIPAGFEQTTKFASNFITGGGVSKIKKLANGNFIIVGDFSVIGETAANVLVINSAGAVVVSYNFGVGFNGRVNDVIEQTDGKLIFVGAFTAYNGIARNGIIRLNADGTNDATLSIGTGASGAVNFVVLDSTGNIYIGGNPSFFYNGSGTGQNIYKLSNVGAQDVTYVPSTITPRDIKVTTDNKLLVAMSGPSNGIRRLNTDGTTDGTFSSGLNVGASVNTLAIDGTGKIYAGGSSGFPTASVQIARLNANGSLDGTFSPSITGEVTNITLEGTQLYVSGSGMAKVLDLSGVAVDTINVAFTVNNFLPYGTNYLLGSASSISINVGTNTALAEVKKLTVSNILYESNCFIVRQKTEKNINNTHLLKFYHNSDIYNYEWGIFNISLHTPYTLRVSSSIREVTYSQTKSIYDESTTGRPRVSRQVNKKGYSFEIYFSDEQLHDGMDISTSLKYFEVNGKEYICESYEVEYQSNLNIFKGVATLKDVLYQRRITACASTLT